MYAYNCIHTYGGIHNVFYVQLRSLALPFTVLEWTLPTVPRPTQSAAYKQSGASVPPIGAAESSEL